MCNPLTLQPEKSGRVCLICGRAPPLECQDKGSQTLLALTVAASVLPVLGAKNGNFTFIPLSLTKFKLNSLYNWLI